ncbi:hypothetical protein GGI59_003121 [Rhizobium lentis]|uniref:Uncharacterized protein n=1 Tax=Rhizobium lentis TaxID=1138194 RepID=A0A7W8UNT9_9HYPH|nr:hypothetical protein [Rhizobium lentis]MBB5561445.1 hypothetical protein [Rhizobium lentis]MBB5568029.1 hypothetical protein [Rhizobium lentis]
MDIHDSRDLKRYVRKVGQAFARMVLDRDNQVAFSRIKGSLPVLDRCGKLGLEMIKAHKGEVSAQSLAMPTQMSEG